MKQALLILAVALYLVSLCACGDQTIRSKSKQGSATRQVVQEQMANVTGETTAPPTAISEQQPASDETTSETSVLEPEQMQPSEALPDYEPAQASGEPDVDLTTLSSTMVYSEVYNMMYEPDRYLGKRIKMNGQFAVYENPNTGAVYTACIIMDATACCSQGWNSSSRASIAILPTIPNGEQKSRSLAHSRPTKKTDIWTTIWSMQR